jgi:hypothetical protein
MRRPSLASLLVVVALPMVTGAASADTSVPNAPPARISADPGHLGVRLLDAPTDTRDDPRAQQYVVDHLAPGAVIKRRVEISNTTTAPMNVAVYPSAASIEGGTFLGADGHTANELSTWTTLSHDVVEIAPGARTENMVTVSVPADAAPGERYAAVWAEIRTPGDSGVILVNRVGIRMYVSVGAGNAPASSFAIDTLTAQRAPDGLPLVTAQVHNTGGRALDMSGTLSLTDGPGSLSAGPFPAQLGSTLAPGQSAAVTISLDRQLPAGPWNAGLTLKSGLLEESVEARIQFPSDPGSEAPVAAQKKIGDYLVYLIGGLVLLAVLATAAAITVRRRRGTPASRPARRFT